MSSKREILLAIAIVHADTGAGKGGGDWLTQYSAVPKAEQQALAAPVDELA